MLLLIIVGTSGSLEEQAKSFITYVSVGAEIVVFCGLIIGKNIFQFCCSKRRNQTLQIIIVDKMCTRVSQIAISIVIQF